MLEFLFEFLGEFLLQAVGEALVELGFHSLREPFRKPPNPWLAALGYVIFSSALGGLSLFIFPEYLVPTGPWRVVNLVVTPLALGAIMAAVGAWRAKRGDLVLRIDRFSYGFVFALSFALVRFFFANDA